MIYSRRIDTYPSELDKNILNRQDILKNNPFPSAKSIVLKYLYSMIHELRCVSSDTSTYFTLPILNTFIPMFVETWNKVNASEDYDEMFEHVQELKNTYTISYGQASMASANFYEKSRLGINITECANRYKNNFSNATLEFRNFFSDIDILDSSSVNVVNCFMFSTKENDYEVDPGCNDNIVREKNIANEWKSCQNRKQLDIYYHSGFRESNLERCLERTDNIIKKYCNCSSTEIKIDTGFDISGFLCYDANKTLKQYILRANTHTKVGGLEFFYIPYYFLSLDNLDYFCSYLDDIKFYYQQPSSGKYSNLILVAGKRRAKREVNIEKYINVMHDIVNKWFNRPVKFELTIAPRNNILFRSSHIDIGAVEECLRQYPEEINKVFNSNTKKLFYFKEEDIRHPLLPPSPGQLGLTLVSGFIDGIIEEENGYCHVIKGSTTRRSTVRTVEEGNQRHTHTTSSHGTMVRVVTPDGIFKNLL